MTKPDENYRAIIDYMGEDEALEFVSARFEEAIEDTEHNGYNRAVFQSLLFRVLSDKV